MRRDWGMTLVVAALVVLSGCAAIGGGTGTPDATATERTEQSGDGAPTDNPTATDGQAADSGDGSADGTEATGPTPTTEPTTGPTATQTPMPTLTPEALATPSDGTSLPPGIGANGRVNETALLVAHLEAANSSGWRLDHRNGNDTRVNYHADGVSYARTAEGVTWYSDGVAVTNRTYFGPPYEMSATHNASAGRGDPTGTVVFALAVRLSTGNYEWTGTTDVDGRTLHELQMTGTSSAGSTLDHYTGRMLVDDSGRIHRLVGEVGENESAADTYDYDYEWGVETVPRPSWFDSVPRGVAEKTPNGTALNVTMTGGPAVPADAEFRFTHNGTTETVTLDEPLEPGDSLYVGLREGEGDQSVVVAREPLDGEGLRDLRGKQTDLSGTVTVDGTEVDLSFTVGQWDI
ncbi:hypothetical protein ACFQMA_15195 [Halosimplex aquaticum]|uniref:Uncharacterized protein n=1 Tax=Halosimplex aquaticum TaxID=3026162 RepID=A0ABD5Y600_9EURY|nr:hypothetical protein [Halosimplex aquaticum]